MPEGRTPGRHDGRDAEVRRFSPLPLRRHPSSRARQHLLVRVQSLVTPIFLLRSIRCRARLSLLLSRFPRRFIFSPSRGPPLSSLPQEKSRAPSPSLGTRHAKCLSFVLRVFSSPPSSPFRHQVFLRLDMLARERRLRFFSSKRSRARYPVVAVDLPEVCVSSPSTLTAVTLRRHGDGSSAMRLDFTRNVTRRTTRLRCSTSRTPLARRSSSHAHRLPHHRCREAPRFTRNIAQPTAG